MSRDWNVHCVTCNDTLSFSDANHRWALMAALCRHAPAIGGLRGLDLDPDAEVELKCPYGWIDIGWFAEHASHELVPIDEYGAIWRVDPERGQR